jgi:ATP synthase F1 gamma subunit
MGKAYKVKSELLGAGEMVTLIQTLKDIADNKFYTLINQKYKFRRFGETFVEFFRMINLTQVTHPLIANQNKKVAILVVTIEGSFLGQFNNKIIERALEEKEKHEDVTFIAVGSRSADRLRSYTKDLQIFSNMEGVGAYEMAIKVKNYLVDLIVKGQIGKVLVAYCFPKGYDIQKVRLGKLLPCDELISKQAQFVDVFEKVIEESDPKSVIERLANLWVTTRLYEIFMDTTIASAAAQATFLEESVDKMKKEHVKTKVKFRKAKKSDIDTSLRETFSARMMATAAKR